MGLVDSAKQLKRKAEAALLPQRFIFHHVPKCGGTSVGRALRKRYVMSQATVTPESSFRAFEAFTGRSDREQMLIDVLDLREQMLLYLLYEDVRGVSLHVRYSQAAWERFGDTYKLVTILREPVARFVSHFNWSHDKPEAHARIDEDFDAFLDTPRARRLGATYVEYFCGMAKDADITSSPAIDAAIANLGKFAVIGNLSDMADFEAGIARELRVKVKVAHENRIAAERKRVTLRDLPDTVVQKVHDLCAPDIAVWTAVREGRVG